MSTTLELAKVQRPYPSFFLPQVEQELALSTGDNPPKELLLIKTEESRDASGSYRRQSSSLRITWR